MADREVAAMAEINVKAEAGTMTVIKDLTPKHIIQPIKTVMSIGRNEHYKMTTPGLARGQHLLATAMFEQYMLTQREIREQFNDAVEVFCRLYPSIRDKAKTRLGSAYKESDFPTVGQIRGYFDYSYKPSPVPSVGDWRMDGVSEDDLKAMREDVEASVKDMYTEATKEVFTRAQLAMEKLAQQAKNYSLESPGAMLRDATIENIKEIAALTISMNITGDPELHQIGVEMQQFADLTGEELRRSSKARESVAKAANAILEKMLAERKRAA